MFRDAFLGKLILRGNSLNSAQWLDCERKRKNGEGWVGGNGGGGGKEGREARKGGGPQSHRPPCPAPNQTYRIL